MSAVASNWLRHYDSSDFILWSNFNFKKSIMIGWKCMISNVAQHSLPSEYILRTYQYEIVLARHVLPCWKAYFGASKILCLLALC